MSCGREKCKGCIQSRNSSWINRDHKKFLKGGMVLLFAEKKSEEENSIRVSKLLKVQNRTRFLSSLFWPVGFHGTINRDH